MFSSLQDMISRLKLHSDIIGLVRYGGRTVEDTSPGGDFDLFMFVRESLFSVESLHFYVQGIPVDLNLRTLDDLRRDKPLTIIDRAILSGEILYDRLDVLPELINLVQTRWGLLADIAPLSPYEIAFLRFSHRHALDKVKHRLTSHPVMSAYLLSSNVYWLVQNYFRVRGLPFPGERAGLEWLAMHDPVFHSHVQRFYQTNDLAEQYALNEILGEHALEPVGGLWHENEVIVFPLPETGDTEAQKQEMLVFSSLFNVQTPD